MALIFDAYDEEFQALSGDISTKISHYSNYDEDPDTQLSTMNGVEALLKQARDLLKQMEIEVRSLPTPQRKSLQEKVKSYRQTLKALERDAKESRQQQERNELLGVAPGEPDIGNASISQRQRLLDANDSLQRQNDTLGNARRMLADTEDVALEITMELGRNRERIQGAHQRVRDVFGLTDVARRLVHSMSKRETQQRVIAYGAIVVAIILVSVLVWQLTKK